MMTEYRLKQIEGIWMPVKDPASYMRGGSYYQEPQIAWCVDAVNKQRPGLAVDGGAHIGLWAQRLVNYFDHVACFEPIPENFECLKRNTEGLQGLSRYGVALSDCDDRLQMGLLPTNRKSYQYRALPEGNFSIRCQKLDTFNLQNVDLIKLDVEGHELAVLRGAEATLEQWKPVVMIEEKHDHKKRASRFLEELGMKCQGNIQYDYLFTW